MIDLIEVPENFIFDNNNNLNGMWKNVKNFFKKFGAYIVSLATLLGYTLAPWALAIIKLMSIINKIDSEKNEEEAVKKNKENQEAAQTALGQIKNVKVQNFYNQLKADDFNHTFARFLNIWLKEYENPPYKILQDYADGIISPKQMGEIIGYLFNSLIRYTDLCPSLELADFVMKYGIVNLYKNKGLEGVSKKNIEQLIKDMFDYKLEGNKKKYFVVGATNTTLAGALPGSKTKIDNNLSSYKFVQNKIYADLGPAFNEKNDGNILANLVEKIIPLDFSGLDNNIKNKLNNLLNKKKEENQNNSNTSENTNNNNIDLSLPPAFNDQTNSNTTENGQTNSNTSENNTSENGQNDFFNNDLDLNNYDENTLDNYLTEFEKARFFYKNKILKNHILSKIKEKNIS